MSETQDDANIANTNQEFNFENSIKNLENIVKKLESTNISLEDSLKFFEKGVSLTKECEQHLRTAQQKIEVLTGKNHDTNEFITEEFNPHSK